jgi:hypothetical protein
MRMTSCFRVGSGYHKPELPGNGLKLKTLVPTLFYIIDHGYTPSRRTYITIVMGNGKPEAISHH